MADGMTQKLCKHTVQKRTMQSTQAMLQASALYKSHILFYKIQSLAVGGIL